MKKLFFIIFCYYNCNSQVASFDTSFDTDGINTYCLPVGTDFNTYDSEFQSTGKIIQLIATGNEVLTLMRWNSNGTLDSSFGNNGILNIPYGTPFINGGYSCNDMTIQPDDKILVMGLLQYNINSYWIARLLPNGALDTTFNGTGVNELNFGTVQDRGRCIALQNDGKILLGGNTGETGEYFSVARLNSNGSLDTAFGTNGLARTAFSELESTPQCIAIQTDGKIVLGGYTVTSYAQDFALARFNTNGTLDTTFGNNGKVITTLDFTRSDRISNIIVEPDGKITAAGHTSDSDNPKMAMTRYLQNGTLDTSFGNDGVLIIENGSSRYSRIARQIDGKYILTGGAAADVFQIFRYNYDGTVDTTFFNNGFLNPFPITSGYGSSVLIQPDNKIVITGTTSSANGSQGCLAVLRLSPGTLNSLEFNGSFLNLYPNPTYDNVYFDNSTNDFNDVTVYNYLGQEIVTQKINISNNEIIDLKNFSNGVYLLKFMGDKGNLSKKIIKQ